MHMYTMVTIPKPGSLLVVCGGTSPEKRSSIIGSKRSHKQQLSPSIAAGGSWKDSLDDLSKELQKICHSPVSNPGSPSLSRNSPDITMTTASTTPPSGGNSPGSKSQQATEVTFPHFPIPAVLVQNLTSEHTVLRVRHEETKDLLQKRLSMISGYRNSSDGTNGPRRPSKDIAAIACSKKKQQEHNNTVRFRTLVNIGDCPHEALMVICERTYLSLFQVSNGKKNVEFSRVEIPADLDLERLVCTAQGQSLEVKEFPKKAIITETAGLTPVECGDTPHYHCPVVIEDVRNNLWKLVWHVPEQFDCGNMCVKTVDEKLVITCRQRNLSGSNNIVEQEKSKDQVGSQQNLSVPVQGRFMKTTIELPENVEPKTVSAIVTKKRQLIIQGISSWRARCMTY